MKKSKSEGELSKTGLGLTIFIIGLFAVITVVAGVKFGSVKINFVDALKIIIGKIIGFSSDSFIASEVIILWNMRMPRMLLALAVGGGLAIGGCAMQALTQNILADPYILGVSSGASAMVTAAFLLFGTSAAAGIIIPSFAFAGALLSMVLVYSLGMNGSVESTNRLVLTGMAVSVVLNAMSHFILTMLPNAYIMTSAAMWMWGSLASARWGNIAFPIAVSLVIMIVFSIMGNRFNLLSLGEETAVTLGMNIKRMRRFIIVSVSILVGTLISSSGLIGFVGFIIPHTVRIIFGVDHRKLFALSFIVGGIFLAWMDILSRTLLAPREFSVGIFSAFFGGPFFIYLIYRQNKYKRL